MLQRYAYWHGWKADVEQAVRKCDVCASYCRGPRHKQGPLQPQPAGAPFEKFHIDLTGPHPPSNGCQYLLTGICSFTKYLVTVPIRDKSAVAVADALIEHVYLIYGCCEILVSDCGREFVNDLQDCLNRALGIYKIKTTSYRPSSNGVCERVHSSLHRVFAKTITTNQKDWSAMAKYVTWAYNISYHTVARESPYFLMFGRQPKTPLDVQLETPMLRYDDIGDYTARMLERMRTAYELVSGELQCAFGRAKIRYDSRVKAIHFEVGQYVLYTNPAAKPQLTQKWILQTTGPHLIVQKLNNVNYRIQLKPAGRVMTVHIDRLVRYEGEISNEWRRFAERLSPADMQGSINPAVRESAADDLTSAADMSGPKENGIPVAQVTVPAEESTPAADKNNSAADAAVRPQRQHRPPARYQQLTAAMGGNNRPTAPPQSDIFPEPRPSFQLSLADQVSHRSGGLGHGKVVDSAPGHCVSKIYASKRNCKSKESCDKFVTECKSVNRHGAAEKAQRGTRIVSDSTQSLLDNSFAAIIRGNAPNLTDSDIEADEMERELTFFNDNVANAAEIVGQVSARCNVLINTPSQGIIDVTDNAQMRTMHLDSVKDAININRGNVSSANEINSAMLSTGASFVVDQRATSSDHRDSSLFSASLGIQPRGIKRKAKFRHDQNKRICSEPLPVMSDFRKKRRSAGRPRQEQRNQLFSCDICHGDALQQVIDCSYKVIRGHTLRVHGRNYVAGSGSRLFESLPDYLATQRNVFAGGLHGHEVAVWRETQHRCDQEHRQYPDWWMGEKCYVEVELEGLGWFTLVRGEDDSAVVSHPGRISETERRAHRPLVTRRLQAPAAEAAARPLPAATVTGAAGGGQLQPLPGSYPRPGQGPAARPMAGPPPLEDSRVDTTSHRRRSSRSSSRHASTDAKRSSRGRREPGECSPPVPSVGEPSWTRATAAAGSASMQASGPRLLAPSLTFLQQPRRSRADVLASFLPRHAEPSFVVARDAEGRISEITRRAVEADFRAISTAAVTPTLYSPSAPSQRHDALLSEGDAGQTDRDADVSPFGDVVASHSQTSLTGLAPSVFMMEVDFPPSPAAPSSDVSERQAVATLHDPQSSTVGDSAPAGLASKADATAAGGSVVMMLEVEDVTPVPSPSAPDADAPKSYGDVPAPGNVSAAVTAAENISAAVTAAENISDDLVVVVDVPDYIPGMTATHRPYPRLPFDMTEGQVVAAVMNHPGRNEREVFQRLMHDYALRGQTSFTAQQAENLSAVIHACLLSMQTYLTIIWQRVNNWGQMRANEILHQEGVALASMSAGWRSVDSTRDRVSVRPSRTYHEELEDYQREAEKHYDYEGRQPNQPLPRSMVTCPHHPILSMEREI